MQSSPPDTPRAGLKNTPKMADEQSHTEESQATAGANAATSGSITAQNSQRKAHETKRTPPKLHKKGSQQNTPRKETQKGGDSEQEPSHVSETNPDAPTSKPQSRAQSKRRQSRGRGRSQAPESDTESMVRSDLSDAQGGRRNRNRKRKPTKEAAPPQTSKSSGGPLDSLDEVGETTSGALDKVQDTAGGAADQAGQAVGGAKDQVGKTVGGLTGGSKKGKEGEDGGKGEQLRLRIELNLDLEIQLKAKINGDITIGLLN